MIILDGNRLFADWCCCISGLVKCKVECCPCREVAVYGTFQWQSYLYRFRTTQIELVCRCSPGNT